MITQYWNLSTKTTDEKENYSNVDDVETFKEILNARDENLKQNY